MCRSAYLAMIMPLIAHVAILAEIHRSDKTSLDSKLAISFSNALGHGRITLFQTRYMPTLMSGPQEVIDFCRFVSIHVITLLNLNFRFLQMLVQYLSSERKLAVRKFF